MNLEKAKQALKDLENQFKTANDQALLLNGAVQGAKAIIEALEVEEIALEEAPEEIELPVPELSEPKRRRK